MSDRHRMVLISEQEYARLRASTPKVVQEDYLPADQQQKILATDMLEERRMLHSSKHVEPKEPLSIDFIKNAIEKFAVQRKRRALEVFEAVQYAVAWDDKGEVTINSEAIPGSNILDLIYFSTNSPQQIRSEPTPPGWTSFQPLVPRQRVPRERVRVVRRGAPPPPPPQPAAAEARPAKRPAPELSEWMNFD